MKLVIASDIHGSARWCRALMHAVEREQPDTIVLLGDVLYHGPRNDLSDEYDPKQVAALLNEHAHHIVAVRGNCDSEVDQMMLEFPCMGDYIQLMDGSRQLFCTHGHLWWPDALPSIPQGSSFLYGHTHIKQNEERNGIHIFNPGSVGYPKDGSHSYGVYVNGEFQTKLLN